MEKPKEFVDNIKSKLASYFNDKSFDFRHNDFGLNFEIAGESLAVNRFDSNTQVKVRNFFDDLWYYINIKFKKQEIQPDNGMAYIEDVPYASIVFFQGKAEDEIKSALLRAEWDSYPEVDENINHPQPHWHITSDLALQRSFEYILKKDKEAEVARELVLEDNNLIVSLSKVHFSMCSDYNKCLNEVKPIISSDDLSKWIIAVFNHVETELRFIKNNS